MSTDQDLVRIKEVHWLRVCPILNLWQAVRLAFRIRIWLPCLFASLMLVDGVSDDLTVRSAEFQFLSPDALPLPLRMLPAAIQKVFSGGTAELWNAGGTLALSFALIVIIGVAVARSAATEFCRERAGWAPNQI